jgi:hypothetical protein
MNYGIMLLYSQVPNYPQNSKFQINTFHVTVHLQNNFRQIINLMGLILRKLYQMFIIF